MSNKQAGCDTCRFAVGPVSEERLERANHGTTPVGAVPFYCVAHPPQSVVLSNQVATRFPLVSDKCWCGDHEPKQPETVTEGARTLARHVLAGDLTAARALIDNLHE